MTADVGLWTMLGCCLLCCFMGFAFGFLAGWRYSGEEDPRPRQDCQPPVRLRSTLPRPGYLGPLLEDEPRAPADPFATPAAGWHPGYRAYIDAQAAEIRQMTESYPYPDGWS